MSRKPKERKIGKSTAESMSRAVDLVLNANVSLRQAAQDCEVKFQTLQRYVNKKRANPEIEMRLEPNYANRQIFNDEQEKELSSYLETCSKMAYGLSTVETRKLVFEVAEANKLNVPPSWSESKLAGVDWLRAFLKRKKHLSIRKPEACSLSRLTSFNRHNVTTFFNNLENILKRHPTLNDASRIYNLDETGTTTVQNPKNVIALKGVKQVNQCTSGERGQLITMCGIISGNGTFLPPAMIFPRKFFKAHMLQGAPPGSLGLAAPSGWNNSEIFCDIIDHFIKHSGSTKENPTLLIFDNAECHISVTIVKKCRAAGVILLTLPPHCSNRMQPLDLTVFGPFKAYYNSACDLRMMKNPGIPMTIYNVADCIGHSFVRAFTPANIISGFRKSGISPYNPDIFTDADFLASSVTDRLIQIEDVPLENHQPGPSGIVRDTTPPPMNNANTNIANNDKEFISPQEIRKFPKARPGKLNRVPRKKSKSKILTGTPEKTEFEEKEKAKVTKAKKKLSDGDASDKKRIKTPKVVNSVESDSTDSEGGQTFECKDDSSDWEPEGLDVDPIYFSPDMIELIKDSFILVKFPGKVHYVGKMITEADGAGDMEVDFLRKSNKVENAFLFPDVKDIALINKRDIRIVLLEPLPSVTKRQSNIMKFGINFQTLNMR